MRFIFFLFSSEWVGGRQFLRDELFKKALVKQPTAIFKELRPTSYANDYVNLTNPLDKKHIKKSPPIQLPETAEGSFG